MRHLAYIIACFVLLINIQLVNAQGDVKIGKQVWTSKNLDVSTFRNGDPIPQVTDKEEWVKYCELKKPAWCYYNNDPKNGNKYGKLYNAYAVLDPRGLSPKGYRIPTENDFKILMEPYNKMIKVSNGMQSGNAGPALSSKTKWGTSSHQAGSNIGPYGKLNKKIVTKVDNYGTNVSGFSALPQGIRTFAGHFINIGEEGTLWSCTTKKENSYIEPRISILSLRKCNATLYDADAAIFGNGHAVRCIKE